MIDYLLSLVVILIILLVINNTRNLNDDKKQSEKVSSIKLMDIEENDFILRNEIESLTKFSENKYSIKKDSKK
jgi:hypothetical protein